ncbi:MAG: tetraacyldisaccharide 4'-kinase [Ignavibacteriaceae bacterium]
MRTSEIKILRLLLYPLVPFYWLVISVRNFLFDKSVFRALSVGTAVISVGNISVGGSGKTPLVIYLTNMLKNNGIKVGVLSRGYGRSTKGFLQVSDGKNILTDVEQCGDEIYHTVIECKVPAAVSENRVKGADELIRKTGVNAIVLDDAFQHRWIKRDIDIVLIEQKWMIENSLSNRLLLPAGNLREPLDSLKRADIIVLNRKFSEKENIPAEFLNTLKGKKIFTAYYKADAFVELATKKRFGLKEFEGQKSLVVSGIANPYSFLNALKKTRVDTENRMIFRDHKQYTLKEVQNIRRQFYQTNSHSVVTTEKDAVKLMKYAYELDDIDVFYLKINMNFDDETDFNNYILSELKQT